MLGTLSKYFLLLHNLSNIFYTLYRRSTFQENQSILPLFQSIAKFEAERDDVRQAVRGEFVAAMDSLTAERSALMNQVSEIRLKLAEAQSDREAAEKQWRVRADEEAAKIHARLVLTFITG